MDGCTNCRFFFAPCESRFVICLILNTHPLSFIRVLCRVQYLHSRLHQEPSGGRLPAASVRIQPNLIIHQTGSAILTKTCKITCHIIRLNLYLICSIDLSLRNCTEMEFLLFCGTQPVIESSNQLRFGCFQFAYFSLLGTSLDLIKI